MRIPSIPQIPENLALREGTGREAMPVSTEFSGWGARQVVGLLGKRSGGQGRAGMEPFEGQGCVSLALEALTSASWRGERRMRSSCCLSPEGMQDESVREAPWEQVCPTGEEPQTGARAQARRSDPGSVAAAGWPRDLWLLAGKAQLDSTESRPLMSPQIRS